MSKNLPDFQKKLKDLCRDHQVFIKSATARKERPGGVQFIDIELTIKDDEQEGEQELTEISRFTS